MGEEGAEDVAVEVGPMRRLGGAVDPDDADRAVVDAEVKAQDAPTSRAKMIHKYYGVAEVEAGAEDDEDAFRVTCAGHVEEPHARPDGAPPCREGQDGSWVCGQLCFCQDGAMS
jgi:hypothetical protein